MIDLNNATAVFSEGLNTAIQNTASDGATVVIELLMAIIIFVLGWAVAVILSKIFGSFLKAIKLEGFLREHRVDDALGTVKMSSVLEKILKYYILLWVINQAFSILQLATINVFLTSFLLYAPALIGAALIILIAFLFGEYVREMVVELDPKSAMVTFAGRAAKVVVVYVGLVMGLSTAGFNTTILDNIFLVLLQAVGLGLALAFGIAFGLGGQRDAQDIVVSWRKNLKI